MKSLAIVFAFTLPLLVSIAAWSASGITYHGRILKPNGQPLESSNARFRIQIKAPDAGNCILWEEEQSKNLLGSNGVFTITIGDSTDTTINYLRVDTYGWSMERVFSNRLAFNSLSGCSVGGPNYVPNASDGRILEVSFKEAVTDPTWEVFPATKINMIPMALNSLQLEGYRANEFLKIDPFVNQAPLSNANVNTLLGLIAGTSTLYSKPTDALSGDLSGTLGAGTVVGIRGRAVTSAVPTAGQVLKFDGTAWAPAADDSGGSMGDASYAAKGIVQFQTDSATSGITVTAGVARLADTITAAGPVGGASTVPVITYDAKGRLTTVSTVTVNDTTKLPLSGGTMTGPINMGLFNLTNATSVAANNFSGRNLLLTDSDTNTITLRTPNDISANYALTLPLVAPTNGQILSSDGTGQLSWVAASTGSVTSVTATSPVISSGGATPVISLDTGLAAGKIPQVGGTALGANGVVVANGLGTALVSLNCAVNQVIKFDASGFAVCGADDAADPNAFLNGGNSYGTNANLGTNDNFALNFETNGTAKMTVLANGNVGIGTTSPNFKLELVGTASTMERKLGINGKQMLYLPDQSAGAFEGSLFVGDGGGNLAHSASNEGQNNVGVGFGTFSSNTTGSENVAIGTAAFNANIDGYENVAIGSYALNANTSGYDNIATGPFAMYRNTTGHNNVATGFDAISSNTAGSENVATGSSALKSNTIGQFNVATGHAALYGSTTGLGNVAIGYYSLFLNKTKSESTAIGHFSMSMADPVSAAPVVAYNTALGAYSLQGSATSADNTGVRNTALGHSALKGMSSGSSNTAVGYNSGSAITTGSNNVILGSDDGTSISTLSNNVLISDGAGNRRITINSSGNVGIGTTNPSYKLEIAQNSGSINSSLMLNNSSVSAGSGNAIRFGAGGMQTAQISSAFMSSTNGTLSFDTLGSGSTLSERMRITSVGNVGIGTTSPATKLDVSGAVRIGNDATACAVGLAGSLRYNAGAVEFCNGSSWQALGVSGSGLTSLNGQTGATQTFAIGSTGTAPAFSSASNVHTLNIPLASGMGVTSGTISKTDYDNFNNKIAPTSGTSGGIPYFSSSTTMDSSALLVTNGVVLGGGAGGAPTSTAAGTANQVFRVPAGGGAPAFGALDLTASVSGILPIANGGTNSSTALTNNKVMISSGGAIIEGSTSSTLKSNNTFVMRDGSGNLAAALGSFDQLAVNGAVSGAINIYAPSTLTSWNMTLPLNDGDAGQVLSTDGSGGTSWVTGLTSLTGFLQDGNSFGAAATLGTNDNFALNFETNGTTKMTVLADGNVGIGTTSPTSNLSVSNATLAGGAALVSLFNAAGSTQTSMDINHNGAGTWLLLKRDSTIRGRLSSDNAVFNLSAGANDMVFNTNSVERARITSTGNVGVGTTVPSNRLDVLSTGNNIGGGSFNAAAGLRVGPANGSGIAQSLVFGTDTGRDIAYIYSVRNNSAKPLILNPDEGIGIGRVGIGALAPTAQLDINVGLAATPGLRVKGAASQTANLQEWQNNSGTVLSVVDSAGNVGIGTISPGITTAGTIAAPNRALEISGDGTSSANAYGVLSLTNNRATPAFGDVIGGINFASKNNSGTGASAAILTGLTGAGGVNGFGTDLTIWTKGDNIANAAERFRITNSGNVGIGTSVPASLLEVTKSQNTSTAIIVGNASAGASASSGIFMSNGTDTFGSYLAGVGTTRFSMISTNGPGGLFFDAQNASGGIFLRTGTTPTSRVAIDPAGNVGIGVTNPGSLLQVAGDITPDTTASKNLGSTSLRWNNIYLSNSPNVSSDSRLKKDVVTSDLGLDFVNTLRPVSWTWKDPNQGSLQHYGVIAQETEAAIARAKGEGSKNVIVSHDIETDSYSVRYTELIAPVIKAIQELYLQLTDQEEVIKSQAQQIASKADQRAFELAQSANELEIQKLKTENAAKDKELAALKARMEKIEKMLESKSR